MVSGFVHTSVVRSINVSTSSENQGGSRHCACSKCSKNGCHARTVTSLNSTSHRTDFADSNKQQQHTMAATCACSIMQRCCATSIRYHWICAAFAKSGSNMRMGIEHSGMERGAQVTGLSGNAGTAAVRRAKRKKQD